MRGRGIAYIHYKHNETYVAMGMGVAVERASGRIRVERVACAHDCGQIINPNGVRAQVEGSIMRCAFCQNGDISTDKDNGDGDGSAYACFDGMDAAP